VFLREKSIKRQSSAVDFCFILSEKNKMRLLLLLVASGLGSVAGSSSVRKYGKPSVPPTVQHFTLCDHPYRQSVDHRMLPMISSLNTNLCPVARGLSGGKSARKSRVKLNCTATLRQRPWWEAARQQRPSITLSVDTPAGHKMNVYL
jgi:hypothetical protein